MKKLLVGVLFGFVFNGAALSDVQLMAENISKAIPGVTKEDISKTPIAGLYQVVVGARVIYASEDGTCDEYLLNAL